MTRRPRTSPGYMQSPVELPTRPVSQTFRIKRKPAPSLYDFPLDALEKQLTPTSHSHLLFPSRCSPEDDTTSVHSLELPPHARDPSLHLDYWNDDDWQQDAPSSSSSAESEEETPSEQCPGQTEAEICPLIPRRRASTLPSSEYATPPIPRPFLTSVPPHLSAPRALLKSPLAYNRNSLPAAPRSLPATLSQSTSNLRVTTTPFKRYSQPLNTLEKQLNVFFEAQASCSSPPFTPSLSPPPSPASDRPFYTKKQQIKDADESSFEEFWSEGHARSADSQHTTGHYSRTSSRRELMPRRQSNIRFSIPSINRNDSFESVLQARFDEYAPPTSEQLEEASKLYVIGESGIRVPFGDLWRDQKTIVIFIRHFLCPFCQDYLFSISRNVSPEVLSKEGVKLVIIGNGHFDLIRSYRRIFRTPFEIYTDPSLQVYSAMGMTLQTTEKGPKSSYIRHGTISGTGMVIANAVKVGMPVWKKHGDISQLGGEFILGPGNECNFSHRMRYTRSHLPILDIVEEAGVDMVTPLNILTKTTGRTFLGLDIEDEVAWMSERKRELRAIIAQKIGRRGGSQWHENASSSSSDVTSSSASSADHFALGVVEEEDTFNSPEIQS
ncbi:hypothetical protein V5O48_006382 [Marasmius crinis-equi]|uniref:Uncharacterized protein n=1 Tax=Marasmius crinis-equi TaxID=585013 RepID=A0ABR3FJV7_9AGAR